MGLPRRGDRGQTRDRDTIEGWAQAEGVDLDNEAQRAREKLKNADRARE